MKEVWKDIPGHSGYYQASNMGRIRRGKPGNRTRVGKILKPSKKRRYYSVSLYIKGEIFYYNVHQLIAMTFIGPARGLEVNHKNGNRADNRLKNLEYVTRSENSIHSIEVLNKWPNNKGEKHGRSKLTEKQVMQIRKLWTTGKYFQREIAQLYGISQGTVGDIVNRRSWKHLS